MAEQIKNISTLTMEMKGDCVGVATQFNEVDDDQVLDLTNDEEDSVVSEKALEKIKKREKDKKCEGDGSTCAECGKTFSHSFYFNTHISCHLNDKDFLPVGQCAYCGLVFSSHNTFATHMNHLQSRMEELARQQAIKAAEEAKKAAEEVAKRKAAEEKARKEAAEARRLAEERARKAYEEAKKAAEEKARKATEEAIRKAEEEALRIAEENARKQQEEKEEEKQRQKSLTEDGDGHDSANQKLKQVDTEDNFKNNEKMMKDDDIDNDAKKELNGEKSVTMNLDETCENHDRESNKRPISPSCSQLLSEAKKLKTDGDDNESIKPSPKFSSLLCEQLITPDSESKKMNDDENEIEKDNVEHDNDGDKSENDSKVDSNGSNPNEDIKNADNIVEALPRKRNRRAPVKFEILPEVKKPKLTKKQKEKEKQALAPYASMFPSPPVPAQHSVSDFQVDSDPEVQKYLQSLRDMGLTVDSPGLDARQKKNSPSNNVSILKRQPYSYSPFSKNADSSNHHHNPHNKLKHTHMNRVTKLSIQNDDDVIDITDSPSKDTSSAYFSQTYRNSNRQNQPNSFQYGTPKLHIWQQRFSQQQATSDDDSNEIEHFMSAQTEVMPKSGKSTRAERLKQRKSRLSNDEPATKSQEYIQYCNEVKNIGKDHASHNRQKYVKNSSYGASWKLSDENSNSSDQNVVVVDDDDDDIEIIDVDKGASNSRGLHPNERNRNKTAEMDKLKEEARKKVAFMLESMRKMDSVAANKNDGVIDVDDDDNDDSKEKEDKGKDEERVDEEADIAVPMTIEFCGEKDEEEEEWTVEVRKSEDEEEEDRGGGSEREKGKEIDDDKSEEVGSKK